MLAILFSFSQGEDGSAALSDGKGCPVTLQWLSREPWVHLFYLK